MKDDKKGVLVAVSDCVPLELVEQGPCLTHALGWAPQFQNQAKYQHHVHKRIVILLYLCRENINL